MRGSADGEDDTAAERAEERLAIPVIVAAVVSVPAVFLMAAGGAAAVVGAVLNWSSVVVLVGESLLLLWLSRDRFAWLREHKWTLLVAAATVPAVVLVIGPVQVLRLVLAVGAIRLLRVRRILRAGAVLRRRAELGPRRSRWLFAGLAVLAAVFATIVLTNPESASRRFLAWAVGRAGPAVVVAAVLVLALVVMLVVRFRPVLRRRRR